MAWFRGGYYGLLIVGAALLAVVWTSPPVSAASQLEAAESCTGESQRLERLACFDRVFTTPVQVSAQMAAQIGRPVRWQQAYALEQKRAPGDGALYRQTGRLAGHLITMPALGTRLPRPLLTVQCHNNITELSLMLPQSLPDERIELRFATAGQQLWRTRDEGFVFSGGRGLLAIETIKAVLPLSQLELTSDSAVVNGLVFDLSGLAAQLAPLRTACGW